MNNLKFYSNYFLIIFTLLLYYSCNANDKQLTNDKNNTSQQIYLGDTVSSIGKDICDLLQDKKGVYWFASNGQGIYRYDGRILVNYKSKHGLVSDFVTQIQEDINGVLWISTRDGICSFNGNEFSKKINLPNSTFLNKLSYKNGGLFFNYLNNMSFYDGKTFTQFSIKPSSYQESSNNMNRPYRVYSSLVDKDGKIWFGTQEKGVCCYDGTTYTYHTELGLDKAAVRTLFQDKHGVIWAGTNGAGLFKFNGKEFTNFTTDNGLTNPDFLKNLKGKEGTLARPWTISEDQEGNVWIGTIDAGIWKYDGTKLTNYTTKDGIEVNSIWKIYKDKNGVVWFVINGDAIYKYNGKSFSKFEFITTVK